MLLAVGTCALVFLYNTRLLKVVDPWKRAIDNGLKSVTVFLDLRKAFDIIKHEVLLTRLESYGAKESELRWFKLPFREITVCRLQGR